MKNTLLGLSAALVGGSLLAFQAASIAGSDQRIDVRASLHKGSDPRLIGLPAGPGAVPAGTRLAASARTDDRFSAGLQLFDKPFHKADGLGSPNLNANSCRACHQDPMLGGAGALELNVSRFGDDGGGTHAFMNLPGGQIVSKLYPPWVAGREEYSASATVFEQRQTPSLLGAGLIDTIPDAVIVANEDPSDLDGNGIFGVARRVNINGQVEIGKFGWKAQIPQLRDFIMDAMAAEMGVTTPDDGRGFALLSDSDGVPDPEFSLAEVDLMDYFLDNLPEPKFLATSDPVVAQGEQLFSSVGCAVCHIPSLDGASQKVGLFSDLLLHDVMGPGFRGMAEPGAGVGMYRTPPLWGIRDTAPYMHDGRASSLSAAISSHAGEAAAVVANYQALAAAEQNALLRFLQHL